MNRDYGPLTEKQKDRLVNLSKKKGLTVIRKMLLEYYGVSSFHYIQRNRRDKIIHTMELVLLR